MLQDFFNLLNDASVIDNVEATAATIKTAVEDFGRMQERIHTLLVQATKSYEEALADLADVKAAMESFVTGVDNLKKQHDAGEGWVKDFRAKVYGTATVSAIFGPIGVALTYAIAAGIVETKIKEWEVKIDRLYTSIKTARQSANSIMLKADKRIAYINTELDLIAHWKSKVRAAIDSAGDMIDIVQGAFDSGASATIIIQKNRVVKVLDDLSAAAQAYLGHDWVADEK
jgi:transcriptional regulator/soluble cytochrome b562